jgi:hypothetical protein
MSDSDGHASEAPGPFPPDVPDIERRVRFYPRQLVGLVILATIPVLAMLGLLDAGQHQVAGTTPALEVEVEYPARMRVSGHEVLRIVATNRTGSPLEGVRVLLPDSYMAAFAAREVVQEATPDYVVTFPPIEPGRSRTVQVALLAERFGRHEGPIRVVPAAGDTLILALRTLILP